MFMSHDDFGLHEAVELLNGLASMLLEAGRSTPVGALVGSVSRLTKSPKPTAGLGWGIVVGAAAVLAISAIRKNRPSAVPAAGRAEPRGAPVAPDMNAAGAPAATSPPAGEEQGTEAATATAAAESTPPAAPAKTPRRKSSRKPAGGTP